MSKILLSDLSHKIQKKIKESFLGKDKSIKKRNKYNAKKVNINGYKFDSTKEGKRYVSLMEMMSIGAIDLVIRQPILDIDNGVTYRPDFLIMKKVNNLWEIFFEDVKGIETKDFKVKKKLIEGKYGIEINIV